MSEPFDFEAFIRGTQLARRTVSAYRIDHRDEIARLTREHDALPAVEGDERETSAPSPRHALAERIKALRDEMEASRTDFVIRTLTPEEFRKIRDSDDDEPYEQLSLQSVEPHLTADQWRKVADVIGIGQWGALVDDANALVLSKVAVPDFSRTVSESLKPRTSSES